MEMPFGKYRGQELSDVPGDYLVWVLENVDMSKRPTLRAAIEQRLGLTGMASGDRIDLVATIRDWYRRLALDFHPDHRGSNEAMLAINEARDRLCKMLKLPN